MTLHIKVQRTMYIVMAVMIINLRLLLILRIQMKCQYWKRRKKTGKWKFYLDILKLTEDQQR